MVVKVYSSLLFLNDKGHPRNSPKGHLRNCSGFLVEDLFSNIWKILKYLEYLKINLSKKKK